jgi:hypothetical protein
MKNANTKSYRVIKNLVGLLLLNQYSEKMYRKNLYLSLYDMPFWSNEHFLLVELSCSCLQENDLLRGEDQFVGFDKLILLLEILTFVSYEFK